MYPALRTTLLFAFVAIATCVAAATYYPWPEVAKVDAMVNKPLFEDYSQNQVRSIKVVRFNRDRSELEQVQLRRRRENWVFPTKSNYVATGAEQISLAINSLMGRTVYEMISDNKEDHNLYGVVDPDDFQQAENRTSLGTKIELLDANDQVIGSLIVGLNVKNDRQRIKRFVRVTGQPQVYVIDYEVQALASKFQEWNHANLFELATQSNPGGNQFSSMEINSYRTDAENLGNLDAREHAYQLIIIPGVDMPLVPKSLRAPDESGKFVDVEFADAENAEKIRDLATTLGAIIYSDVRKKDSDTAKALRNRDESAPDSAFASLNPMGFAKVGFENTRFKINSVGGDILVNMMGGIQIQMSIGTIAGADRESNGKLTHYVMFNAGVDTSVFPVPADPGADADETAVKAFRRAEEKRKNDISQANLAADDLNRIYADWYYIVSEDIIKNLRPDLQLKFPTQSPETSEAPDKSADDESIENKDE